MQSERARARERESFEWYIFNGKWIDHYTLYYALKHAVQCTDSLPQRDRRREKEAERERRIENTMGIDMVCTAYLTNYHYRFNNCYCYSSFSLLFFFVFVLILALCLHSYGLIVSFSFAFLCWLLLLLPPSPHRCYFIFNLFCLHTTVNVDILFIFCYSIKKEAQRTIQTNKHNCVYEYAIHNYFISLFF